jgi:hypothetical protein
MMKFFMTMKKYINKLLLVPLIAAVPLFASSCLSDDDDYDIYYDPAIGPYNAIVTVKIASDGSNYFQLTDSTVVIPTNMSEEIDEETRALCYLDYEEDFSAKDTLSASVKSFKKVLTKSAVLQDSDEGKGAITNQDPVEILSDWTTVCEDGYLTLHFAAQWGNAGSSHIMNLVKIYDNPLTFRFCHDKNGDYGTEWGNGIVAFSIRDLLPDDGKDGTFTLQWLSYEGEKDVTFKYLAKR